LYTVYLKAGIIVRTKLGLKARHANVRKPFFEAITGAEFFRKLGIWVSKERVIDRDGNHYREVITNPKTGEIIHHCEEPLSDHRGHGSAKDRTRQ
jgi:hypothetical protein